MFQCIVGIEVLILISDEYFRIKHKHITHKGKHKRITFKAHDQTSTIENFRFGKLIENMNTFISTKTLYKTPESRELGSCYFEYIFKQRERERDNIGVIAAATTN